MIYLDHAATTKMRPEVWEAMAPFSGELFGNSSGSHATSRQAKNALEEARERAAAVLGCAPSEIVFTGGGTEADNLALKGLALAAEPAPGGVVTVATEHEAVLESAAFLRRLGAEVTILEVDRYGRVDPARVLEAVTDRTAVVSVMLANNETGTLQPVREIAEALGGRVPLHTDAVQAFVSEPFSVDDLGVDLLSLSAHKFGGPKGTGLLYVREGTHLEPVLHGGGQELGRRSGTHDLMGAVGTAVAMEVAATDRPAYRERVGEARRRFEAKLADIAERTVPEDLALCQHAHLRFPGIRNESMLVLLDRRGVAASAASACQSGATTVSHVLSAMGYSPVEARECLRFSFGWDTTSADAESAAESVIAAVGELRR